MFNTLLSILLVTFCFSLTAQPLPKADPQLRTPYDAVLNHLQNLQQDEYNPKIAALSMYPASVDLEKAAIDLKQYMDAKGLWIETEKVPREENYYDSIAGANQYSLFASESDIFLVKYKGKWVYSEYTTKKASELREKIHPYFTDFLHSLLPNSASKVVLGIQLWQWLGLVIVFLASILIYFGVKILFHLIFKGLIDKHLGISEKTKLLISRAEKVGSLLVMILLVKLSLPSLILPIEVTRYTSVFMRIFTVVFVTFFAVRVSDILLFYASRLAQKTESILDDQLLPIVSKLVKVLIFFSGLVFILGILGVNVTALIAGLSIGGLAVALAAQDTVKNMIGSVMIFVDKPFEIGDWITFEGNDGIVEEVGVRSTRIRTFADSLVYVPNGKLSDSLINNMGLRKFRRFRIEVGVTYDTPPNLINAFIDGIREILAFHPSTINENYYVYLNNFGPSSLNILVQTFFNVKDYKGELAGRHDIMEGIIILADKLGVRFAFPSQTLYIEQMPGQISLSPNYENNEVDVRQRVEEFVKNYRDKTSSHAGDQ